MLESPVLDVQRQAGAVIGEAHGWNLPSVYTSLQDEYVAATEGVGLLDRSYVGRLKVLGEDAIDLLNRLSTNNLEALEVGQVMGTVLTSNKGRIIDLLFVLRFEDHLLILTSPECRERVAEWIDFYTFVEDVTVQDDTESTAMFSLLGPRAAELLGSVAGQDVASLAQYEFASLTIGGQDVLAIRTDFAGSTGFDLVAGVSQAESLWSAIADNGAFPVGTEALDTIRIEYGVPVHGKELSEDYNPLEANLMNFISFNKGCYIGQEVVARLNTYEKVQKHIWGLSCDTSAVSDIGEIVGADVFADGKSVGNVTSVTHSPRLGKSFCLGYVRNAQAEPGMVLQVHTASGEVTVTVENLPLV